VRCIKRRAVNIFDRTAQNVVKDEMTEEQSTTSHLSVAMTTSITGVNTMTSSSSQRGIEFYFYCAVLIIGVVGTAANGLILYALVVSNQHKKHPLIVNQNVLDISCSFTMVISHIIKLCDVYLTGSFGKFVCIVLQTDNLTWLANTGAVINLALITVERYVKVVHSTWSNNKLRKWMIYSTMPIPWIFGLMETIINVASRYPGTTLTGGVCYTRLVFFNNAAKIIYIIWTLFFYYFIIIFIFAFCYWRILVVVRRQARVMAGHSAAGSNAGQAQLNQIQTNVIKTMILVSLLYTILWLPMYVAVIILHTSPYPLPRERMYYTTVFSGYLYMCINPFIYATKFDPVKQVLLRMIPCKNINEGNAGGVGTGAGTGQAATNRTTRTKRTE